VTALTLAELKNFVRYEDDDTSQETALGIILSAGQRWVENYTGHVFVQRVVTESPAALGDYHDLRWRPYVADSLTISILDEEYVEDDTFEDFAVYQVNGIWRVKPHEDWPTTYGGYTFSYMAGYEEVYDIPEHLLHAVALYGGMSDEQRGDMSSQGWKSLYALLEQDRMPVLA
jgi:hypothetical protein